MTESMIKDTTPPNQIEQRLTVFGETAGPLFEVARTADSAPCYASLRVSPEIEPFDEDADIDGAVIMSRNEARTLIDALGQMFGIET